MEGKNNIITAGIRVKLQ